MPAAPLAVTPTLSRDIVAASLDHLAQITLPGGRFIYAHEVGDTDQRHDGYNLLRHSGTLWFMARAMNETGAAPTDATLDAIRRATGFLGRKLEPAPWARPDQPSLALVGKGMVKLGGIGLGLLALAEVGRIVALQGSLTDLPLGLDETVARLRRYALDEIDGNDFRHKRVLATGEVTTFRSDYYTGEAIFGLLLTGSTDADLTRVTTGLMRRGYGWAQQSHWMAYAACEAVERDLVPKTLGATYLTGLMEAILGDALYRYRRQSTPIACRTEALTRVLLLARRLPGLLSADLLARVRAHAAENLSLQLDWYKEGQFRQGDGSQRVQIDYIQHNATAFLHWAELES
ncbi:hypothetical protein [Tabrizicola sp.]|uniref:hypothetical protein n=1 Tax=Tabrizicola sp. TaxID=2005166 RepID=UPI001A36AAB1|nr:hypothetical protein [Tabrizicola sp.]MBL9074711.1 hypothetical protein [Tabrizicola sp.]